MTYQEYLAPCCQIAREAGALIMGYFAGNFATQQKEDKSPVTDADIAANEYIVKALAKLTPHLPIIAEENDNHAAALLRGGGWLVDPLDGTRSFVRGEKEFTVNIGLVENGLPVLGVLYVPAQDVLYYAAGEGAYRVRDGGQAERIHARAPDADGLIVTRSQSHASAATQAWLDTICVKKMLPASSAVKFCWVAEGSADIYPRFGRTMEWDTAAGHAILNAAGGRVETADGQPLLYGKPGFENPAFIAYGKYSKLTFYCHGRA